MNWMPGQLEERLDEEKRTSALLRAEIAALKYTIVETIGGTVEGHPTQEINYLQRLRQLRRIETALGDVLRCFDVPRAAITGERVEAWREAAKAP